MRNLLLALVCAETCSLLGYLFPLRIRGECLCAERPPFIIAPFYAHQKRKKKQEPERYDDRVTRKYPEAE